MSRPSSNMGQSVLRRSAPAVATMLLAGFIFGAAWQLEGLLAAQRVMVHLAMPVGLAWLSVFFAAWHCLVYGKRVCGAMAGLLFTAIAVLFSPLANREWMRQLETSIAAVSPLEPEAPQFAAVVVLGGGSSLGSNGHPQLNADGQRVVTAAQMWHAGKVAAIICTGEDNYIPGDAADAAARDRRDLWNPARQSVEILMSLGVPEDRLHRVGGMRTAEEMHQLRRLLSDPPESLSTQGAIGLITSAFHMPRAIRLAERERLSLVPIPVAYRTSLREPLSVHDLVPNVEAGSQFYTVAREWLAKLLGR